MVYEGKEDVYFVKCRPILGMEVKYLYTLFEEGKSLTHCHLLMSDQDRDPFI